MATFFVLVLLGLLVTSAWGALQAARRFEAATARALGVSEDG